MPKIAPPRKIAKGIYLRGGKYWFSFQKQGTRRWISLKTDIPDEAIGRAAQVKRDEKLQILISKPDNLNGDIKRYLAAKAETKRHCGSTTRWAGRALRQFSVYVKNRPVPDITQEDIAGFFNSLSKRIKKNGKPFSENSTYSYIRAVRGFMSWAAASKLRFDNPAKLVKFGKPTQAARTKFATVVERDLIFESADDDATRFILYCTFHAGMRFNEVVQARPDWFNLEANFISIHKTDTFTPKNRKNRTVPLSTPFKKFLENYGLHSPFMLKPKVKQRKNTYRYDFRVPWKKVITAATKKLNAELKKAKKPTTANLKWLTPHLARHTFASHLAQKGVSIFKISEWIGDTVEVCIKHYAHLAPSDKTIDALIG